MNGAWLSSVAYKKEVESSLRYDSGRLPMLCSVDTSPNPQNLDPSDQFGSLVYPNQKRQVTLLQQIEHVAG